MGIFSKLFRLPDKGLLKEKLQNGALLLDVRTVEEFDEGSVKGSLNLPLMELPEKINKLDKDREIVVICESGARSAQAVRYLNSRGFITHNGGGWHAFVDLS